MKNALCDSHSAFYFDGEEIKSMRISGQCAFFDHVHFLLIFLLNQFHPFADSFFVHGDEFVVTFWQGFVQPLDYVLYCGYGAYLEKTAENEHVEHLGVACASSLLHRIDAIDVDVVAFWRLDDGVSVVDDRATWLNEWLELF